jgi:hypothetical protein
MPNPIIGNAIAASESERVLTIAVHFGKIGCGGAINSAHALVCG